MPNDKLSSEDFLAAAARGDVPSVQAALAAGNDADTSDAYGNTALMMACARGQIEVAKTLINAGADVGHTNKFGRGPRQWSDWSDNAASIRSLLG